MGDIGPFDVAYASHALEHVDDPLKALREFHRVLSDGGVLQIVVPDCEGVEESDKVLYVSAWGPITARHLLKGLDEPYMRHVTQFTATMLTKMMKEAGFTKVLPFRLRDYNLMVLGWK